MQQRTLPKFARTETGPSRRTRVDTTEKCLTQPTSQPIKEDVRWLGCGFSLAIVATAPKCVASEGEKAPLLIRTQWHRLEIQSESAPRERGKKAELSTMKSPRNDNHLEGSFPYASATRGLISLRERDPRAHFL